MPIAISCRFAFTLDGPGDVLLQFEAAAIPEQKIIAANTILPVAEHCARVIAEDAVGERIWLHAQGPLEVDYTATVEIERVVVDVAGLRSLPMHRLPGETIKYLLDSRYCPASRFQSFVDAEFGNLAGGQRIAAMCDWIAGKFRYEPGSSDSHTTALDSFVELRGICRDYAHVMVTLARASGIPARYASVFSPGVNPPDFHAVAEVFLADPGKDRGSWHIVDATRMADPASTVKIGVGHDAADVSFLTSFGPCFLTNKEIAVQLQT
jgi:transglutaminase-like putative cysteine protease